MFLKTNISKSYNGLKISKKQQRMKLEYLRKPIGPVHNETKSRPHKITASIQRSQNFKRLYEIALFKALTIIIK